VVEKKIAVIGCAVLGMDIKHKAKQLGLAVDLKFLEAGLHERPDVLKQKLQSAIDAVSAVGGADRIVIGYGVCGRGTVGIQSRNIPLVIPKVHDCVAIFLGGDEAYRREFKKYPGTYYVSAGWHKEKAVPVSQRNLQPGMATVGCTARRLPVNMAKKQLTVRSHFSVRGKKITNAPLISIPMSEADQNPKSTPGRWPRHTGGRLKK
jgi:hypothetical protein